MCKSAEQRIAAPNRMKFITQQQAQQIDDDLMGPEIQYSLDQLMEVAGLAVAHAVYRSCGHLQLSSKNAKVLLVCGPGNNGGDGLVAARHLAHMGFNSTVVYPRTGKNGIFERLKVQLKSYKISVLVQLPPNLHDYDILVDAIFGFGMKRNHTSESGSSGIRAPFDSIIADLNSRKFPLVLSVDVPSGYDVDESDSGFAGLKQHVQANAVVSLSVPKMCVKNFPGMHFLGGRFLPKTIEEKYNLECTKYYCNDDVVTQLW